MKIALLDFDEIYEKIISLPREEAVAYIEEVILDSEFIGWANAVEEGNKDG